MRRAGVGKSFLLTEITRLLTSLARPYQVTATTGIAALQVSGTTLHSWAGVGLGDKSVLELFDRMTCVFRSLRWQGAAYACSLNEQETTTRGVGQNPGPHR